MNPKENTFGLSSQCVAWTPADLARPCVNFAELPCIPSGVILGASIQRTRIPVDSTPIRFFALPKRLIIIIIASPNTSVSDLPRFLERVVAVHFNSATLGAGKLLIVT